METAEHIPVLLEATLAAVVPVARRLIVDCTVGLAGHAAALLAATPAEVCLVGLDLDESNLAIAAARLARFGPRVRLVRRGFQHLHSVLQDIGIARVDAVIADLGVSSNQISDATRGLSFERDGPLDMRLDRSQLLTAAELVNSLPESALADLLYLQADERLSRRISKRICAARRVGPITRTAALAQIVTEAVGRRGRQRIHPATRTFMALRAAVNGEQAALQALLEQLPAVVRPGGRAAMISFHSGEDRAVKRAFATWSRGGAARRITGKPQIAGPAERRANPRSRSAKLRVIEFAGNDLSMAAPGE